MRRLITLALSVVCLIVLTAWQPYAPPEPPEKITPRAWQATESNADADLIVTAQGFPDLSPARTLPTKEAKTQFVTQALLQHAEHAQRQLRADLKQQGADFTPLWISNQIMVRNAGRAQAMQLAMRPDVAKVDIDEKVKGVEEKFSISDFRFSIGGMTNPKSKIANPQSTIEWGVQRVNAPAVWALGYTGQNIIVANLDTGVRWDHAALKPHYRGWNGATVDHNYNWFDAAPEFGPASPVPVDVNGHGTHTVGTSVGNDGAGNQVGVAPGAQWIACRNMAGPSGVGSVARYVQCFQFALAPTDVNGNNPDPLKGADITSNSWGCDPGFGEPGCEVPGALITVTQVLRDAGVMVVASAGNSGPSCSTVLHAPATLDQSFSIGATDSSDNIATFSSRGPSTLTGKLKPDVVAPGVGVRSATFDSTTSYGFKSGTSMAAPHVAGVVALLWSAAPWLRGDVPATEAILRATAKPMPAAQTCGGVAGSQVPNNVYGYGMIDAQAAVSMALGMSTAPTVQAPASSPVAEPVTITIQLANTSAFTRTGVVVSVTLPASVTLISSSPAATAVSNTLVWSLGTQPPSTSITMTFAVQPLQAGVFQWNSLLSFDGLAVSLNNAPAQTLAWSEQRIMPWVTR
jgi:subtilisin family serine protease